MRCPYCDGAGQIEPEGITIGALVTSARKAKGLTQLELAHMVGLSRASVANIETNRQDTTISTITAIAKALDCKTGELLP